jgi:hypothetical protein
VAGPDDDGGGGGGGGDGAGLVVVVAPGRKGLVVEVVNRGRVVVVADGTVEDGTWAGTAALAVE